MTTIISRLYAGREQAAAAAAELRRPKSVAGFGPEEITTLSPVARDEAPIRHAVAAAGVSKGDVGPLTEAVMGGASLVVVRAPFGRALDAMEILDGFGPIAATRGAGEYYRRAESWNDPAPLSRLLGLPVLLSHAQSLASPASSAVVSGDWEASKVLGVPLLVADDHSKVRLCDDPAPFSRALRLPVLRSEPDPRSSLGAPTLAPGDWALSKIFRVPLLAADDHPRVRLFHDPAPLSNLLGLPTLM